MRDIIAVDEAVLPYAGEDVLPVLADLHAYPSWWPSPFRCRAEGDVASGVGTRIRVSNGFLLSWVATLDAVEADRVKLRYTGTAVEGEARWSVRPVLEGTALVHRVDVDVRSLWLRLVAWRYDVRKRHSRQMKRVFDGLEARLAKLEVPRLPDPQPPHLTPRRPDRTG